MGLILDGTPVTKKACQTTSVVENVPFGSNKNVSQHTWIMNKENHKQGKIINTTASKCFEKGFILQL